MRPGGSERAAGTMSQKRRRSGAFVPVALTIEEALAAVAGRLVRRLELFDRNQ